MGRFDKKMAIVTGASSGIGRSAALKLAVEGATVAVLYNSQRDVAERVVAEIVSSGGSAFPFALDLSDISTLEAGMDSITDRLGGLDILVNSGGQWMKKSPIVDCDDALWDRMITVNLTSVFHLCRRAARIMIAQGYGTIVNVSSVVARTAGSGGTVPYCVAKAGVNALTRGLARELAGKGIRVNCVAPGLVDTPMLDENFAVSGKASLNDAIPLKRMGKADELADAILFLASDAASYITGETLEVNGGVLMD